VRGRLVLDALPQFERHRPFAFFQQMPDQTDRAPSLCDVGTHQRFRSTGHDMISVKE
jgi:hypothetical protein